jgi:biotin carboxyl carrier protein
LHLAPLTAVGEHVVAGQALALLQIEHTLVPACAPRDGVVARIVANDGDAVGYGDPLVELLD